jgi:hypothetical protein
MLRLWLPEREAHPESTRSDTFVKKKLDSADV